MNLYLQPLPLAIPYHFGVRVSTLSLLYVLQVTTTLEFNITTPQMLQFASTIESFGLKLSNFKGKN